jgi:hypothetical protein
LPVLRKIRNNPKVAGTRTKHARNERVIAGPIVPGDGQNFHKAVREGLPTRTKPLARRTLRVDKSDTPVES